MVLQSRSCTVANMSKAAHCARLLPKMRGAAHVVRVSKAVQQRARVASQATTSSETTAPSVPQQVSSALQNKQNKLADIASKLQTTEASPGVVREVFQEFQCLTEHVQQLAQHMEAVEGKAQMKAAEKVLKKQRKEAEKALKKERKAAAKAAKNMAMEKEQTASTGFVVEPESDFSAELNHAAVGTAGGDITFDMSHFGSDQPQLDGQIASIVPNLSSASAPAAVISVCQGSSCQEKGSEKLLKYIKSTAGAELDVVPCKCLGKCEQAPNLRVTLPDQKPTLHTSLQNSKEVNSILQDTKAQYGSNMMKSFAAAN